jgi:hypothetical protein
LQGYVRRPESGVGAALCYRTPKGFRLCLFYYEFGPESKLIIPNQSVKNFKSQMRGDETRIWDELAASGVGPQTVMLGRAV